MGFVTAMRQKSTEPLVELGLNAAILLQHLKTVCWSC